MSSTNQYSKTLFRAFRGFIAAAILSAGASHVTSAATQIELKLLADGFTAPTVLTSLADGSGRLLLADQAGTIYVLSRDGEKSEDPFLDLRARVCKFNPGMDERGVLGLALHPEFKSNRKFYVVYSAPLRADGPDDWNHTMHLSEFQVSEQNAAAAVSTSERILLKIDEPDWNHNSGRIAFGPDGYLYMSCGDGGAPNDIGRLGHAPEGNGQHLKTLLGKILRIDVNSGSPYSIPSDNPYADGKKGLPEIYAYGLRNPWGLSFDRGGSHDLIVADVGQDRWEELNIIVNGGNYGWRVREGFEGFDPKNTRTKPANEPPGVGVDGKPFVDPVFVYKTLKRNFRDPEAFGVTITGGYIYRGKAFPELFGKYVFGDWSRSMGFGDGILLVASRPGKSTVAGKWTIKPLALANYPDGRIKAFVWAIGEDEDGEIYVMTNGANLVSGTRGKLFKLVPVE